jgi:hypothetical protein
MANFLYTQFKKALMNKEHDLDTDTIMATLVDAADYAVNSTTDASYTVNSFTAAAKVAVTSLTGCTIGSPAGTFDSANFTWSAVTGDVCEEIVLWNDTPTTPTADPLIAFYDASVTGLPVTPNGGDINVTVNASGWFSL